MDPWKFEDNFQNVCFAGLTTRGIPHGTTRANAENTQERVEVRAHGFARASSQMSLSASNVWFDSHYAGTIAFGVITQVGGNHAPNHNVWVSNIRTMMARPTQFFTITNLPCYEVIRLVETASDPAQVARTDTHRTDLAFAVELGIKGANVA